MALISKSMTFAQYQQQCWQVFDDVSLPDIKPIDWSKWPMTKDTEIINDLVPLSVKSSNDSQKQERPNDQGEVTLEWRWNDNTYSLQGEGIEVLSIEEAQVYEWPEVTNRMAAYHGMQLQAGIVIKVAKESNVTLRLTNITRYMAHKQLTIEVGEGAQLNLIETVQSEASSIQQLTSTYYTHILVGARAQVNYYAVDTYQLSPLYVKRKATLEADSQFNWFVAALNQADIVLDMESDLQGQGAVAVNNVVALAKKGKIQVVDNRVDNFGRNTVGHIFQHGIANDQATLTMNGVGFIAKGAKGADAQQTNRAMMLSEQAQVDVNPILLIDEFEVTAGHAASVGQLDEEQLYYLMSRGIPKEVAQRLVVQGFLGQLLLKISDTCIRKVFEEAFEQALGGDEV